MKITLKDGSSKEYAQSMSVIDIAKISVKGLAKGLQQQEKLTEKLLI